MKKKNLKNGNRKRTEVDLKTEALAAVTPQNPDLVVFNAKVYTVDPTTPRAEAFAIKAGRFVAVGSSEAEGLRRAAQVKSYLETNTRVAEPYKMPPGFMAAADAAAGTAAARR